MRAQLFSFDFIVSIALIILLLGLAIFISERTGQSISQTEGGMQMKKALSNAISALVLTPGNPTNWDRADFTLANVKSLGLAQEPNVLDSSKTAALFYAINSSFENYTLAKTVLGLNFPSANFSIGIYDEKDAELFATQYGPGKLSQVYAAERLAIIDGIDVKVKVKLWVEG